MLMQFILPNLMYALDHLYYVVLPGEYLEIDVPLDLFSDFPLTDTDSANLPSDFASHNAPECSKP